MKISVTSCADKCEGTLVWFGVGLPQEDAAVLECSACEFFVVTGNFLDDAHCDAPLLREGLAL